MFTLDPERWQAVSPHLDEALGLLGDDREAYVSAIRERDPLLAEELRSLLDDHHALVRERFLEEEPAAPAPRLALVGQTLGPYTVRAPIGQGGMGSVWLAERTDGRFERRAAIKLLNVALGERGESRFRREGRLLARLEHPHIAQLTDAGVSETGQPYLVLEYVEGEPIDQYCQRQGLDVDARIRLFLDVLGAVAHAHVHLIVHRDIKPANVLVTSDGQVKLLDFGIAALLEDEQHGAVTRLTRDGGALTPAYAAPEQLTSGPMSTATDVYALGVLLYVLLTGRHPAGESLRSAAELIKAVVETDPPRASDVVVNPLRRRLRGDLDTILGKALKKRSGERYTSVTALADDLRRYLRHEPIGARPESFAYRSAKFVRRNRVAVAAAAMTVIGLSVGLYVANRERMVAERRFSQLRQLSNEVLDFDKTLSSLAGSTEARQRLVSVSLNYLESLAADSSADVDLMQEIGDAYERVARVQGVPTTLSLGDMANADKTLNKADVVIDAVLAARPRSTAALLRSAVINQDRMIMAETERRRSDGQRYLRKAEHGLDLLFAAGGMTEAQREEASTVYMNMALTSANMSAYEDGVRLARRGVDLARTISSARYRVSGGLSILANALRLQGNLDEALTAIREARAIVEEEAFDQTRDGILQLYGVLTREGFILGEDRGVSLDRPAEATDAFQRAFDMMEEVARKDPSDYTSRNRLGVAARELGAILRHTDPARALAVYDVAIGRLREVKSNARVRLDEAKLLAASTNALRGLNRAPEARQRIDAALSILANAKVYPAEKVTLESDLYIALLAQADQDAFEGKTSVAVSAYAGLLAKVMAGQPNLTDLRESTQLADFYRAFAALYERSGDSVNAAAMEARRLEIWRAWERKLPSNPFVLRQLGPGR